MRQKTVLVTAKDALMGPFLCDLVEQEHLGTICSLSSDGLTALSEIDRYNPQFVILDLYLPHLNGISILKEIHDRNKSPQTLCYCRCLNKMVGVKAVKQGATGLIDYQVDREEFRRVMTKVSRGERCYPEPVKELLEEHDYELHPQRYSEVTPRQARVLELVVQGLSNSEIAFELGVSLKMVEKHKHRLSRKFGLASMAELSHFAIRHGIVEKEEYSCL